MVGVNFKWDGEYKAHGQQRDLGIESKYHELSSADQDVRRMDGRGKFKWVKKGLG
jgi:hypothetical protein